MSGVMLHPGGAVAQFIRERPLAHADHMEASPAEHLVEFWNWLDSQGMLARPGIVRAVVHHVGSFPAIEHRVVLDTDAAGARAFEAAIGQRVEISLRRAPDGS